MFVHQYFSQVHRTLRSVSLIAGWKSEQFKWETEPGSQSHWSQLKRSNWLEWGLDQTEWQTIASIALQILGFRKRLEQTLMKKIYGRAFHNLGQYMECNGNEIVWNYTGFILIFINDIWFPQNTINSILIQIYRAFLLLLTCLKEFSHLQPFRCWKCQSPTSVALKVPVKILKYIADAEVTLGWMFYSDKSAITPLGHSCSCEGNHCSVLEIQCSLHWGSCQSSKIPFY